MIYKGLSASVSRWALRRGADDLLQLYQRLFIVFVPGSAGRNGCPDDPASSQALTGATRPPSSHAAGAGRDCR